MKNIEYQIENKIGFLRFNRPEKHNSFSIELLEELSQLLENEETNTNVRAVIFTGKGDKSFSSGVDLSELIKFNSIEDARNFAILLESTSEKIFKFPKPTISAINGFAIGGGMGFASATDYRILSNTAKVGFPAIKLGAILPVSCTLFLNSLIGVAKSRDILLTGRMIESKEALEMGLVNKVVEQNEVVTEAIKIANTILEGNDTAITYTKKTVNNMLLKDIESQKLYAADNFAYLSQTQEWKKRMNEFNNKNKK